LFSRSLRGGNVPSGDEDSLFLYNSREDVWCERVFAPDLDMLAEMQKNDIPLFALESSDPIADFDMIGFTLQYELSFTTVLKDALPG
jgi:hypothetical protein